MWTEVLPDQQQSELHRRGNKLKRFWRELYASCRGVLVIKNFYEHVPRHIAEGRELQPGELVKDAVVEFRRTPS